MKYANQHAVTRFALIAINIKETRLWNGRAIHGFKRLFRCCPPHCGGV